MDPSLLSSSLSNGEITQQQQQQHKEIDILPKYQDKVSFRSI